MAQIKTNLQYGTTGTVQSASVADDAITLAKMAVGTDGNIISYDASTNPVAIATGSDGQVLTSTGAGSPPAFEAVTGTTINTNADNRVITGSGTANTLTGEANLTYNGTDLDITSGDVIVTDEGTVGNGQGEEVQFLNSNDSMRFFTGGTQRMKISDLGIGTIGYEDTLPTATSMGTAIANDATLVLGGANSGATQGSLYLGGQNISANGVEGAVYGFSGGSQNAGIEFLEGTGDAYGQISMKVGQGTGGTLVEAMKIHSNLVVSATAGVALGVGSANTASNVLDDYEEGTWTPTWTTGTTNRVTGTTGGVYQYTKIGRMIHVSVYVAPIATSSGAINFYQVTLPVAAGYASSALINEFGQTGQSMQGYMSANSNLMTITNVTGAVPPANSYFRFGFSYQTA